jgi:hypothetical protein
VRRRDWRWRTAHQAQTPEGAIDAAIARAASESPKA